MSFLTKLRYRIFENTFIGNNVIIGKNCIIGNNVIIHSGVIIGDDGFGFDIITLKKKIHLKKVIIKDNVEIGANTTIDRGSWRDTIISENTKLDNLIHIGHNVIIGKNCFLCAQVGIAGSTEIKDNVHIAGQVGISQRLVIGENSQITAKSLVIRNILPNTKYGIKNLINRQHFK